jgi:5-formyltetrahydrofolate cyclo-ligase
LYYPLKGEVDIIPVIKQAWSDKKTVLLPRCRANEDGVMDFYVVNSEDDLEPGAFGVMEPKEHCFMHPKEECRNSSLCVMPGLTFDKRGYRLGYGKGYYDRYLQGFNGVKMGVVYSDFIYEKIPHGFFDVKADVIVTEKGVNSLYDK